MDAIDFKTLELPSSPNYYLVCPDNFCSATPSAVSKTYTVSSSMLKKTLTDIVANQPRVKLLSVQDERIYFYVQRSALFRFPDYITIEFISIDEQHSTLAIFSQSKYGYSDLGVNANRVNQWLAELDKALHDYCKSP